MIMDMEKLKLNIEKISNEMTRLNKNKAWLANELGVTPAMVTWIFNKKPLSYAHKIAIVFDMEPKDLIK